MMKKLFSIILAVFAVLSLAVLPAASGVGNWEDMPKVDNQRFVHDLGGLMTSEEIETLNQKLENMIGRYGMSAVVVTTLDAQGRKSDAFAEDFYEANGYGTDEEKSGIVFLVDMDNREIDLRAYGKARRLFTKDNVDYVLDAAIEYMKMGDGYVYETANEFADRSEAIFAEWEVYVQQQGGEADYTVEEYPFSVPLPVILAGSFGLSGIIVLIMRMFHNKSMPSPISVANYLTTNGVAYTRSDDVFLRTHTTKTRRPTQTSGGGGSGGGISFGGGSSFGSSSSGSSTSGGSRGF